MSDSLNSHAGGDPSPTSVEDAIRFYTTLFTRDDRLLFRPVESYTENGKRKSHVDHDSIRYSFANPLLLRNYLPQLLKQSAEKRTNLYFSVCPRLGDRGRFDLAWQIRKVPLLWADVDGATVEEVLSRVTQSQLPTPTAVVHSGNGGHLYWLLDQPFLIDDVGEPPPVQADWTVDTSGKKRPHRFVIKDGERYFLKGKRPPFELSPQAERVQGIVAGMSARIGGDSTQDLTRLLRVPGSWNRKDERNGKPPVPCTLVECEPTRRYPIDTFERFRIQTPVGAVNRPSKRSASPPRTRPSSSGVKLDDLIAACATTPPGNRSEVDFALCCAAVRDGIDPDELWSKVAGVGKFAEAGRRYFDTTWTKAEAAAAVSRLPTYKISGIQVIPGTPHITAKKITVPVEIHVDGKAVDFVRLSDAASGRKNAIKQISQHLPGATPETLAELDKALGEILVNGRRPCSDEADRATIYDMLKEHVPDQVRLLYRTETGRAFSEVLGKEISRQAFVERFTNSSILDLAATASDVPQSDEGVVSRSTLIALVERELKVLWGDLTFGLPAQEDAPVGPASTAGAEFRSAMIRLWTKPASMALHKHSLSEKSGDGQSVQLASRTSLMNRVMEASQARKGCAQPYDDQRWKPVQKGYSAWYRRGLVNGEVVMYLAMRWELARQVGVELDGVHDQGSLTKLGTKYQVLDPSPPVSVCISGQQRIAVLAQDVTQELLFDPTLDDAMTDELSSAELNSTLATHQGPGQ